jgi:pyrroline-5-carboxylate reductase
MATFGFIGVGNMGGALARAVCKKVGSADVMIADHSAEKAEAFAAETGAVLSDNESIAATCKYIFLGVKPQVLPSLLTALRPIIKERKHGDFILVTMAAGISIATIEYTLDYALPIIRIMPNTPVSVGEGMILYTSNEFIKDEEMAVFTDALSLAGKFAKVKEKRIDAASVISGCGPAFMYMFLEAMTEAGYNLGLEREDARLYAEQTMLGAAKLAMSSEETLEALRVKVCSPGGSTIEGVKSFEENGLSEIVEKALTASFIRTKELGRG